MITIYLTICFCWCILALYKHRTTYPKPFNNWKSGIITMIINFIIFPYAIYIAVKMKKI